MAKNKSIIIIGAGIAGLAVAHKLQSAGFDVTIFEARDRIGGRIWTDDKVGIPLDLGASWIHGIKKNPINKLAKQYDIKTIPTDYETLELYYRKKSKAKKQQELTDSQYKKIDKYYAKLEKELKKQKSLAHKTASMQTAISYILTQANLSPLIQQGITWLINSDIERDLGADLANLSLKYWDEDEAFEGPDVIFPNGYQQLTMALADGLDIRLNRTVTHIAHNRRGIHITTNEGSFTSQQAIITLPLGILKKGTVNFSPPLPPKKQQAIQRLGMGLLNKIILQFPNQFWPTEPHYFGTLSEYPKASPEFWNMIPFLNQPILIALVSGSYAFNLETLADTEIVQQIMTSLKNIFGSNIPDPITTFVTRWGLDPFSYGSYSHIPPGASLKDCDILAEPIQNRLFFAGEATMGAYLGTTHGAFLSGQREAERIMNL